MKEIETPEKIRKLQQVLHHNAKTNKTWRAWSLYANLLDEDVLAHGAAKVIANKGAAGIDGMSVSSIGSSEACSSSRRFAQSNNWLLARYRKWLWKKHKGKHSYYGYFTDDKLHGTYRLHCLPTTSKYRPLW